MIYEPYKNIDLSTALRIQSVSHTHTRGSEEITGTLYPSYEPSQIQFLYDSGIRHFGISNYHRSYYTYPLIDHWPEAPDDAIGCKNAEYYSFLSDSGAGMSNFHVCGIGCNLIKDHMNVSWRDGFRELIQSLVLQDGGGITINHPHWTGLSTQLILQMLDYDQRVLGIEVYDGDGQLEYTTDQTDLWDEILITGRKCLGFGVPDWAAFSAYNDPSKRPWRGRNVLLVNEATENSCLRAYRNGEFYVALYGTGLTFNDLVVTDDGISVAADGADKIAIIVDGVKTEYSGTSAEQSFGKTPIYVRAEAFEDFNTINDQNEEITLTERIMSQPYVFRKPDSMEEQFITIMAEA